MQPLYNNGNLFLYKGLLTLQKKPNKPKNPKQQIPKTTKPKTTNTQGKLKQTNKNFELKQCCSPLHTCCNIMQNFINCKEFPAN